LSLVKVKTRRFQTAFILQYHVAARAGLSKCGARLGAILRGPIQWRVQKVLRGASGHNDRNRWWKKWNL